MNTAPYKIKSGSLAVPTDLSSTYVDKAAPMLNALVADAFALYVKTKNFHWHVAGKNFRDYHLLFDEQASQILDSIDAIAERVRKIGATTIRSIGDIKSNQTISDNDEDFVTPDKMVLFLLKDNKAMAVAQRAAIEFCESNKDSPTSNLLQEVLDGTERRIWFLFELTQNF